MSFETPHGNGLSITAMTVEPRQGCPLGGVLLLPKLQRHVTGESKKRCSVNGSNPVLHGKAARSGKKEDRIFMKRS
jgi:hypothetical protein